MSGFESVVEEAAIAWLAELGWHHVPGPVLAPDGEAPERESYRAVVLEGRLRRALARINDHLPPEALDEGVRAVTRLDSPSLEERNRAFHKLVREGVSVTVKKHGRERGDVVWLFDHDDPGKNDWLVVSQLTVVEGNNKRRPDLVLFVNGLPLAVIEFKSPSDPNATIEGAHNQLQLYKDQIPSLFNTNVALAVSDGTEARVGSLTAGVERFGPWRTLDGEALAPEALPRLQVLLHGLFQHDRFLDYMYHFILWETGDGASRHGLIKKIAGYHQFHAVNKAVAATVRADMRRKVKRLLRKHGYPPDRQEAAVLVVIEQAERVCRDWARAA